MCSSWMIEIEIYQSKFSKKKKKYAQQKNILLLLIKILTQLYVSLNINHWRLLLSMI